MRRHPLLTQVLEQVQSFRSGLVYLHVATNEMEPTSWREAQWKADEKVHLLRHMQRAFVVVNRWQRISGAPLKVRREATNSKIFNCKIKSWSLSIYLCCIYGSLHNIYDKNEVYIFSHYPLCVWQRCNFTVRITFLYIWWHGFSSALPPWLSTCCHGMEKQQECSVLHRTDSRDGILS